MTQMQQLLFGAALLAALTVFVLLILQVVRKGFEFWPPPSASSWQSHMFRTLFRVFFVSLIGISILDFDTTQPTWRYFIGTPLLVRPNMVRVCVPSRVARTISELRNVTVRLSRTDHVNRSQSKGLEGKFQRSQSQSFGERRRRNPAKLRRYLARFTRASSKLKQELILLSLSHTSFATEFANALENQNSNIKE